jgi:hypothetical protein
MCAILHVCITSTSWLLPQQQSLLLYKDTLLYAVCRASLRLRSNQALNASLQWAYSPSSLATGFETKLQASRGGFA